MRQGFHITCFVISLLAVAPGSAQAAATHPLDALDAEEIRAAVRLLRDAGNIDDTTLFSSIQLAEPPKAVVKSWTSGKPIPCAAQIVARTGGRAFAGVGPCATCTASSPCPTNFTTGAREQAGHLLAVTQIAMP